ncbi:MAG: ATP-binding cassette domain-containing protein [Desulfobacterales bacterium]|nr:ATP-binding cassette domain-containing protein [Desulfobacterales bacterium]
MRELAIQVDKATKTFKAIRAVDALSFEVQTAQCFGLLGPNGAGKSTMMNMLYGKTRRDGNGGGQINVFGYDPEDNALAIKFLSGIVPQENNLDIELSVLQNLLIYSRFYGLKKQAALPRIETLLAFMELTEKINSKIRDLSGGMQRRLVIARALINQPKLLILDEPTTGLDPQVRQLIWDKLRMLQQEGVTILLCTHYMEEAFQICDRLIIMNGGRKVMEGKPATLISEHMEPWVLEAFGADLPDEKDVPDRIRVEKTAHRVLLYSKDLGALKTVRNGLRAGDYFLRQSNLEDLFLKTTGRKLNE